MTPTTPLLPRPPRIRPGTAKALRLAAVPVAAVGAAAVPVPAFAATVAAPCLTAAVPTAAVPTAALPPAALSAPAGRKAAPPEVTTYVVRPGDTLSGIALRLHTDVATLVRLNRLADPDALVAGARLVVPVRAGGATRTRPAPPAPTDAVSYTVKPGDTVWDIATRAGTTVQAVLAANHLTADAVLMPGQVLLVPGAKLPQKAPRPRRAPTAPVAVHVVLPGETVTSIAAAFHLAVADVLRANHLDAGSVLRPGQKLLLPGVAARRVQRQPGAPTHAYVVRRGDTLSGIALAAHVPLATVLALNHLSASDVILPGQRLLLPGAAPRPTAAGATSSGGSAVRTAAAANRAALAARSHPGTARTTALVRGTAKRFGLDPALAVAVAAQESGLDQRQVSAANAVGVMQVVPSSGRWASALVGRPLDLLDARDNVVAGVAILSALRAQEGEERAVAAYYQGLGSLREHGMFADTRRYVADVLALRRRFG